MAYKLDELECYSEQTNTGRPFCVEDLGIPVGVIATRYDKVFTREEIDDLEAVLNAASIADSGRDRMFYIGPFDVVAKAGDDRQQQTFSTSGRKRTTRRGKIGWSNTMASYGIYWHQSLMVFDGKEDQYNLLLVTKADGKYKLAGYHRKTTDGSDGWSGFNPSDIYVGDYELADGSNGYQWLFDFELADSAQWNNRIGIVTVDFSIPEVMAGLQTAQLINLTPITGGTANKVVVRVIAQGVNLQTIYAGDLAQTAGWTFKKKSDGTTVVVSGVAQLNGDYVVTLTSATGLDVIGSFVVPSALAALPTPVEGIESNTISVKVP